MRKRRLLIQIGAASLLLALLALLINNLAVNLIRTGIGLGFGWLGQPAGFALAETALPYAPSNSYLQGTLILPIWDGRLSVLQWLLMAFMGLLGSVGLRSQRLRKTQVGAKIDKLVVTSDGGKLGSDWFLDEVSTVRGLWFEFGGYA